MALLKGPEPASEGDKDTRKLVKRFAAIPPPCRLAPGRGSIVRVSPLEETMRAGPLNSEQFTQYERDGYLLVKKMFDAEEIGLLLRSAKEDRALDQHAFGKADGE